MSTDTDTEAGPPLIDFSDVVATPDPDFIEDSSPEPDTDFVTETYDQPDTTFVTDKKRSRKAVAYEKKTASMFNGLFRVAIANPATVPDAAAITMHAKPISEALGDLADADPRIERAIDFITSGTENPYANLMAATVPLVLQLMRNHEPVLEPKMRGFRIPFGKRKGEVLRLKFGVKLRGIPRNLTNDPDALAEYVFSDPRVMAALQKQGLNVVRRNGNQRG